MHFFHQSTAYSSQGPGQPYTGHVACQVASPAISAPPAYQQASVDSVPNGQQTAQPQFVQQYQQSYQQQQPLHYHPPPVHEHHASAAALHQFHAQSLPAQPVAPYSDITLHPPRQTVYSQQPLL